MGQPLPNLGLIGDFTLCDKDIVAGLNVNFQLLDNLVQLAVDDIVAVLPTPLAEGEKYILSTDKTINLWNGTTWISYPAQEGYLGYNKADSSIIFFNGTDWVKLPAELIFFDNTGTGFTADNLQDAILEMIALVNGLPFSSITNLGGGAEVYKDTTFGSANLRTITSESTIEVTQETNTINLGLNISDVDGDVVLVKRTVTLSAFATSATPSTENWDVVGDGNGNLVGVSLNSVNTIRSSDNGTTWVAGGTLPANQWRNPVYGDGVFVVTSGNGTNRIYRSLDNGVTWIAATTSNNTLNYQNNIFLNGKFISATAAATNLQVSTDLGDTWSSIPAVLGNTTNSIYKLSETRFLYVGLAAESFVLDSDFNIITSFPADTSISRSTYGNGVTLISSTSQVFISYNEGMSFSEIPSTAYAPLTSLNGIAYGDGIFFIISQSTPTFRSVYSTDNGKTWSTYTLDLVNAWDKIIYDSGRFIVIPFTAASIGRIDFSVSKELGTREKKSVSKTFPRAFVFGSNTVGGGAGSLLNPPEGVIAAAQTTTRTMNTIQGYRANEIITLATNTVTFKKSGWYSVTARAPFYRTNRSDFWLEGTVPNISDFRTSSNNINATGDHESEIDFTRIFYALAGQTCYLRHYNDAAGVTSQVAGQQKWCPTNVNLIWASLDIQFLGD